MNTLLYSPSYYTKTVPINFPYAISALGAYLQERDYAIALLDGSVENDLHTKLKKLVPWADIMGVSMTTFQVEYALRDIAYAKTLNPDLIVVAGGVHPTLMPEQTIEHPLIDYVIVGEGEGALRELIDAVTEGTSVAMIKNLVFHKDGTIVKNEVRPIEDIDALPAMNWNLLKNCTVEAMRKTGEGVLLAGKGCNYKCTFCFNSVVRNIFRGRSVENIMREIDSLITNYSVKNIYFRDENFLCDRERAVAVATAIIDRNYNITWEALSRVSYLGEGGINDEDCALLVKSGLRLLKFGAESGDQAMLNELKKGITVEQIYEAARMCKKHGIKGSFSFMTGLPGETWEQYMKTLDCIDQLRAIMGEDALILGPHAFYIYPMGDLYKKCIELGYKEPNDLQGWADVERHPVTGVSEYYWHNKKEYHYIQNISIIRALNHISISKILLPPYSLRDVRNFFALGVIIMEKIRWRFRWFGAGLAEMRMINFIKKMLYNTWFASI